MVAGLSEDIADARLYRGLSRDEVAEFASGVEVREFRSGEVLMTQGDASDGAYLIRSGVVTVSTRLPGGGETGIAELGPGQLVGEMALLMRGGKRTATARALGPVEALFTDSRYFEAALQRLRPASLKVLRQLGLIIAERLRAVRLRSRGLLDTAPDDSLLRALPSGDPWPSAAFDVRAFLPILPCLRDFAAGDIDALLAIARVEQVDRGAVMAREGQAVDAPRLVVRGALLLGQRTGEGICQLDVLGPGRFAGVAPSLEGAPAGADIIAAEDSTLLAFDPGGFAALCAGQDRLALRLLEGVIADLVQSLNTASNHLTRLTAQARVRDFTPPA